MTNILDVELMAVKPILKWAGGKSQMMYDLLKYVPNNFNKYIEPFVGGGALFFNMKHHNSVIADSNEELIITYTQIRDEVSSVINLLKTYENSESFFYYIRALQVENLSATEIAARLIYLNKTCFNGLYRVNKKGEFNTPYGWRKGLFLNEPNLIAASNYLKHTNIIHADYKTTLEQYVETNDFIFIDPPYFPVGEYSDFKRYTKESFHLNDQIELAEYARLLVHMGCKVMLTNSNHPYVYELYDGFKFELIETKRLISSNPETRTGQDLIILGGI